MMKSIASWGVGTSCPRSQHLHSLRNTNTQRGEAFGQLPARDVCGSDQDGAFGCILLGDNAMAMVKKIEGACEIESILCQVRGLGRRGALSNDLFGSFGEHHERPDFRAGFSFQGLRNFRL